MTCPRALSGLSLCTLLASAALAPALGAAPPPPEAPWQTPAERSGYAATPSLAETGDFLVRLAARWPALRLERFGRSAAGREMTVAIVSTSGAFTPAASAARGEPVVLVLNGIHAGEIDGKDASLALLRDLALGRRPGLVDGITLLVVPVYNVDGHERVSRWNRPNQDGPREGMGFRTTADGTDLNRDFLKATSPEARSLLALVNAWRPHLVVDVHVTNGSDHDWVLTWSAAEAPQLDAGLDAWLGPRLAAALAATAAAGHRNGPYVELRDPLDPARGFSSWVGEPRYSTGYFPLRQRPSVLVEMHSHKPYERRVPAVTDFLASLLAEVGAGAAGLVEAVAAAERRVVELGRPGAEPSLAAVELRPSEVAGRIRFPVYDWFLEESVVTGRPFLRYRRGQVREVEVPWTHRGEVARSVPRPRGYLVLPGWPEIEARLAAHGLVVHRLEAPAALDLERYRLGAPRFAERTFQGLTRLEAEAELERGRWTLPAGSLWVPADQPDFEVAVQLFEPAAPDSLLRWGLLSRLFEQKEWIGAAVLEREARRQLADPAVATAWERALADPDFAASRERRYLWWYQRTPYYDGEQGILPVYRLPGPPPVGWPGGAAGRPGPPRPAPGPSSPAPSASR
ncbi:MAG: M14 family metallopeptidase [Thermoanaerobaculia bacterium]|nr:M14 family metallopeptidase [Thermoanaerobaculia bacterium]